MLELDILVDRLKLDAESKRVENLRFVEEQKIRRALGPSLWSELKASLKHEADRIRGIGGLQISAEFKDSSLRIWNLGTGAIVSLAYDDSVPCVHCDAGGKRSHLAFQVVNGTSLVFLEGTMPRTLQEIALWAFQAITI